MSEHKSNAVALFNATLPALLHGDQLANATFELKVLPKENVLLLLPHHIRHTEVGAVEIQVPSKPGEWQAPPEGADVWEIGQVLPADKCDVAFVLGSTMQRVSSIETPGKGRQVFTSQVPCLTVHRIPLDQWRREHEANMPKEDLVTS